MVLANLEIDTVELVEARPSARRRKTLEELAQCLVVETVRAVEYDTLLGHGLGQILDSLGLARTSGTLGRAAQMKFERSKKRSVATVGQRRHNKTIRVAKILVTIGQRRVDHARDHLAFFQIVTQLAEPGKLGVALHAVLHQLGKHIASCSKKHRAVRVANNETTNHMSYHVRRARQARQVLCVSALTTYRAPARQRR
jgi:hypothetical protein